MKLQLNALPEWLEASEGESDKIPRFRMTAYTGGVMNVKGFNSPVVIDLAGVNVKSQKLPILFQHDAKRGIGHTTEITVSGNTLTAAGIISRSNEFSFDVVKSGKRGFPWQASVGGQVLRTRSLNAGQSEIINGRNVKGPVTVVSKFNLYEISFVEMGADEETSATIEAGKENVMSEETKAEEKTLELEGYLNDINELKKKIELLEVRAARPSVPFVAEQGEFNAEKVAETSFLLNCGFSGQELQAAGTDERTINKAMERKYSGETLQSFVRRSAGDTTGRFTDSTIRAAFERSDASFKASFGSTGDVGSYSTVSLPGILSNVANKILEQGFLSFPDPTEALSKHITVKDFKSVSMYTILMNGEIGLYGAGGELEHVELKETERTAKTETRGAMLTLTREMITNDDLGAFKDLFALFGRKVNLTRQKAWFSVLMDNLEKLPFAEDGLEFGFNGFNEVAKKFSSMTDDTGDFIAIGGKFLLIPPALETTAAILEKSVTLESVDDNTVSVPRYNTIMTGTVNPFYHSFKAVSSPYFSSFSPIEGGSDTHYLLFASPSVCPVMGSVWLHGNRRPYLETGETSFNTLGIGFRCYFDYKPVWLGEKGAVYCAGDRADT